MPTPWRVLEAKKRSAKKHRRIGYANPGTLHTRLVSEAKAAKGIQVLIKWFAKKGYEVRFGSRFKDEVFYDLKRVKICSRPSLQSQLIGMLHEAGHVLVNRDEHRYRQRFGEGWPALEKKNTRAKRTAIHRVQLLEEEFEAWNRGGALARRLRVKVSPQLWRRWRYSCLAHYAGYASKKWEMKERVIQSPVLAPAEGPMGAPKTDRVSSALLPTIEAPLDHAC